MYDNGIPYVMVPEANQARWTLVWWLKDHNGRTAEPLFDVPVELPGVMADANRYYWHDLKGNEQ